MDIYIYDWNGEIHKKYKKERGIYLRYDKNRKELVVHMTLWLHLLKLGIVSSSDELKVIVKKWAIETLKLPNNIEVENSAQRIQNVYDKEDLRYQMEVDKRSGLMSEIIKEDIASRILKDKKLTTGAIESENQIETLLLDIKNELKELNKPSKLKTWFKKLFKK